jgi:hypothetical protein
MSRKPPSRLSPSGPEPLDRPNTGLPIAIVLVVLVFLASFATPSWSQSGSAQGNDISIHSKSGKSVELIPLGVAPPPGESWHVQANDNFDQDESINQALWNGGTGGGMPPGFCGTRATSCGYTGEDCNSYFGTFPNPPYETIDRGRGLAIQAKHAAPGDNKYLDNKSADIQSYKKITIHPGSFVEWVARMPTDRHGEGDGWHVDLWCTTLSRHRCDDSSEVDIAEKVLGTGNGSRTSYIVHDQPIGPHTVIDRVYSAPGNPDLSAGFHTYGLAWRRGGKQGSLEAYIDGKPVVDHSVPITDPSWSSGVYCYAGWMQQVVGETWGGGATIDSHTSQKNPLYIKRFTVWKAY